MFSFSLDVYRYAMGNLAALVLTFCSVPVPELLLVFYIGEGRSEPLYIGTVASSLMCEFNHVLVASFSKRAGFVLKQHTLPSDSFAVRERRDLGEGAGGGEEKKGNDNKIS